MEHPNQLSVYGLSVTLTSSDIQITRYADTVSELEALISHYKRELEALGISQIISNLLSQANESAITRQ